MYEKIFENLIHIVYGNFLKFLCAVIIILIIAIFAIWIFNIKKISFIEFGDNNHIYVFFKTIYKTLSKYRRLFLKKQFILLSQFGLDVGNHIELYSTVKHDIKNRYQRRVKIIECNVINFFSKNEIVQAFFFLEKYINECLEYEAKGRKVAYVGIIAVSFSFYTGKRMSNKSSITIYDYKRDEGKWFNLEELNNTSEVDLDISCLSESNHSKEIILIINTSYQVNIQTIKELLPEKSIFKISPKALDFNISLTLDFQKKAVQLFENFIKEHIEIELLHLFVVTANSLSFKLGKAFNNRNYPAVRIYEYNPKQNQYSWCMEIHQDNETNIIQTNSL